MIKLKTKSQGPKNWSWKDKWHKLKIEKMINKERIL